MSPRGEYVPGKRARSERARELATRARDADAEGNHAAAERWARAAFRTLLEDD